MISSNEYTALDDTQIPTGLLVPVAGSCMDFTSPQVVGKRMAEQAAQVGVDVNYDPLAGTWTHPLLPDAPGGARSGTVIGFDHNFVVRGAGVAAGHLSLVGDVSCQRSGKRLTIHSSAPGVQLYTANYVDRGARERGCVVRSAPWPLPRDSTLSVFDRRRPQHLVREGRVPHSLSRQCLFASGLTKYLFQAAGFFCNSTASLRLGPFGFCFLASCRWITFLRCGSGGVFTFAHPSRIGRSVCTSGSGSRRSRRLKPLSGGMGL